MNALSLSVVSGPAFVRGRAQAASTTEPLASFEWGYPVPVSTKPERTERAHLKLVRSDAPAAPPERTDDELIDGVVAGNGAIAGELYDKLEPTVDRALFRLFGRREPDHEDLVQATFEQIIRTLVGGRFARGCKLTTWAATLASHVGMNALRARRTERRFVDKHADVPDAPGPGMGAEQRHEARSEIELVRAQLAAMDPAKAEAVFMHDVLGHDLAEIAALTGVSVAAAQSRLVRGRKELLERLGRGKMEAGRE